MDNHCICFLNQIHLMLIDINTVSQKSLRSKNVPIIKPVYNSFAMLLQALMKVIDSLSYMNMITYALWLQFIAQLHGLIRNCEGCMHTHHSCQHITVIIQCMFNKIHILHYGLSGLVHAVTVRNLIAKTGSYAQFLSSGFNSAKGACNMSKACMMVKYSSNTVLNTVNIGSHCRKSGLLQSQMAVDGPPLSIQNIKESLGIVSLNT